VTEEAASCILGAGETILSKDIEIGDELIAERRSIDRRTLPPDMPGWMRLAILAIDRFSYVVGWAVCVLTVPIFLAMTFEIVARKFFSAPTIWAYDVSRMLNGAMFMLGAGYALARGVHVRADFLYRDLSVRTQGRIDLALYLLFFFPAMIIFLWTAGDYAWTAVDRGERGMDTAWMPPLGPVKSALPLGILFLTIQGVSEVLKAWYAATHGRWPQ
jgi:TRAP-type mannitol/chloroaromatic compound transport system permease small subunit